MKPLFRASKGMMQTFSLDLMMPATPRVDKNSPPNDFGGPRDQAITMLIAGVFGTGWLAAGQAFSVVLN